MAGEPDHQLHESDVIVLLMGASGVGKSSFIEKLTGEDAGVSDGLCSATTGIRFFCFESHNRRIFLVDTPGFDATQGFNSEVFKELAFCLAQAHRNNVTVGGILYLHRATDNRVSGSSAHGFHLLEKLCGAEAAKRTCLVTTMWDSIPERSPEHLRACAHEEELKNTPEFWGTMKRHGSLVQRWMGTRPSAHAILNTVLSRADNDGHAIMNIQRELIDEKKDLHNTSLGGELVRQHGLRAQKLRKELDMLQDAPSQRDKVQLEVEREILQTEVQVVEKEDQEIRQTAESLITSRQKLYQAVYQKAEPAFSDLVAEVNQLREELRRLESQPNEEEPEKKRRPASERSSRRDRNSKDRHSDQVYKARQQRARRARDQRLYEERKRELEVELEKKEKRKLWKRNLLAILCMLGGMATIAAGAATIQIPVVAVGIALVGAAGMKLDFSRKQKRKKKEDEEWNVQEHDDG